MARLRDEDIPYTVVGGLSLFEAPEIRDLEQGLRAIADPHDSAALVRMMTAGPWRMDALEILRVTRAHDFDRGTPLVEIAGGPTRTRTTPPRSCGRRLRDLLAAIEELNPLTWREGPYTILERYLERTGVVLDLLAAGTLEAKRSVVNIASFMRFASDWQAENPARTLAGFIAYLDAYKAAGGELPTSVELSEDVDGVRLMTLYQAKGLEFPIVIVPNLLDGEWPVREQSFGLFPRELLREQVPAGDLHTDEERRLLYVAMTRAQERLLLMTQGDGGEKAASRFVAEIEDGAGEELALVDRTATGDAAAVDADADADDAADAPTTPAPPDDGEGSIDAALAAARRVMPLPTARERRLAMRLRAAELVGLAEATAATDPEAEAAREAYAARLADLGRAAAMSADEARAAGLDPLTFRSIALDSGAGANLLAIAPLPPTFSYSSLSTYEACPLRYAFSYVYRIPEPDRPAAHLTFGSTAHSAFEAFTQERRERLARGEPAPTREDLERHFTANWKPDGLRRQDHRGDVRAARRPAAGQLLGRRGLVPGRGHRGGAGLHPGHRDGRRHAARAHLRRHRPHRPAARRRHRGHRLQDRQDQQPEGRGREPPAHHLRARLPRRAGPGHAGAGDALLHRERDPAVHGPHGRAAGSRPRGAAGPRAADPGGRVHGHAGEALRVV